MTFRTTFAALILLAAGVSAAQDAWEYRTSAGEYAFANGDLDRAEEEFRGALELAQRFDEGDRRLEVSLENLARLYEHQMRIDEAQPLYQLLLAAQERRAGMNDPALLETLVAVARVSVAAGDSPTAEAALRRYIEIADSSQAADPSRFWRMLSMLGRMQTLAEEHHEALALERRAIEILDEDSGATDLERATELESLAQMELSYGSAEDAEKLLERAVEYRSAEGGGTAEPLAKAASTAFGSGELDVAERLAERALAASIEEGADQTRARQVLADVSWMRVRRGGELADVIGTAVGDAGLATARQRLSDLAELQSPGSPETLERLVKVNAILGETAEAATWQRRYMEATGATAGAASLKPRSDLVTLLAASEDKRSAADENAKLIEALESAFGADSPRLIEPLVRQQDLLIGLGEKKQAKAIKKRIKKLSK
jgi:tetratricopeptide (TPR) repeat protein